MNMEIKAEFKNLIPPLTPDEFRLLETSIINEGCRDAILTWNGFIVDGHNRFEICDKNNIEFTTKEIEFDNEDAVKVWMIDNQNGRRNLTDGWKFELMQTKKGLLMVKGREISESKSKGKGNQYVAPLPIIDNEAKHNTQKELASELGWSTGKVAMADKVWKEAEPEVKESIKKGETTINQAYNEIKKEQRKAERVENNERILEGNKDLPTEKKYKIIYADPPWSYSDKQNIDKLGGAEKHYPTMTIEQLCNMPVNEITETNAVLFLWVTSPLLEECFEIINAWGFKYKSSFIWDKVKHNMGHYNSVRHELLLICTKGSCTPDNVKLFDSVQSIERSQKHSEKPNEFREIIKTLYNGNAIELFSRTDCEGWDSFGNEI